MFRFTIRDVLWLTVVVALAVGWLVDRSNGQAARLRVERLSAEQRATQEDIRREMKKLRSTEQRLREGWGRSLRERTGFTSSPLLADEKPATPTIP